MTSPCDKVKVKVKVRTNVKSIKVKSINHSDLDIGHALVTRCRLCDVTCDKGVTSIQVRVID